MAAEQHIDTFNKFAVGIRGGKIVILVPPLIGDELPCDDALLLAAWLVTMADRDDKFPAVLAAVQGT